MPQFLRHSSAAYLVIILAPFVAGVAAQPVHKCVIEGRTMFQEQPCPEALPRVGDEIRRKTETARKKRDDQEAAASQALVEQSRQDRIREEKATVIRSAQAVGGDGLCKGLIGMLMGRDPRTMNVEAGIQGVWIVSYTRPSDNTRWSQQCRVAGLSLSWGSVGGRWRTEDVLSYTTDQSRRLVSYQQQHSDGSATTKSFSFDDLLQ